METYILMGYILGLYRDKGKPGIGGVWGLGGASWVLGL